MTTTLTKGTFTVSDNGFLDVKFVSDDGYARAELQVMSGCEYRIWGVYVGDDGRRRGLGSALMEHIVALADREQMDLSLWCQPSSSGEWIVGFYERFGFTVDRNVTDSTYSMFRPYRKEPQSYA